MNANRKPRPSFRVVVSFGLLAALLLSGIASAVTVTIDTFNVGNENLQVSQSTTDAFSLYDDPSILGQERDIQLHWSAGSNYITLRVDNNDNNYLYYAAEPQMTGWAEVTWDGNDDSNALAPAGLGGVNLVDGTNDVVMLSAVSLDHNTRLVMSAYTDADNWSRMQVDLRGGTGVTRLDVAFPFSSFTQQGSGPVTWTSVGALVLRIDGTIEPDLDLSIDNVAANANREYGDLPDATPPNGYGTSMLSASHIPGGMRLGYNIDAEATYNASTSAAGDDTSDADDEDGVVPTTLPWNPGLGGGEVEVTFLGCSATSVCYVNGWIDWNNDGDFDDTVSSASERILTNRSRTSDATVPYQFTTPSDLSDGYYYARFRICTSSTACDSPDNTDTSVLNGEIEDYRWPIGPTAVKLTSFTATGQAGRVVVAWETATEMDNLGFNLYRRQAGTTDYAQLNGSLIPSQAPGQAQGASYTFIDAGVTAGQTYEYVLEDVDMDGTRTSHGPAVATVPYAIFLPLVSR